MPTRGLPVRLSENAIMYRRLKSNDFAQCNASTKVMTARKSGTLAFANGKMTNSIPPMGAYVTRALSPFNWAARVAVRSANDF